MEVTRDVILDLLPLYLDGEVSTDTRALVEKFLETDPGLARIAERSTTISLAEDIPVPLTKEDKMEAYLEVKKLMFRRTLVWAGVIGLMLFACMGLAALAFFMLPAG
jgi:anti-sigma factor RsiW